MKKEEGRRKREEGRRKKGEEKVDGDSLLQTTSCLQTSTNCQHRLNGDIIQFIKNFSTFY
ncbi:MAG: hypothetical protein F6K24_35545 [Okeania sp. SIO2D1]|nr:hypothetical protein [Okeania sp. SIO2D1]